MVKISRHIGFIMLIAVLCLIYIANAHRGERKLRKISSLKKEVQDSKSIYQEVKSENTYNSTETQLLKKLEDKGLKINTKSPILLKPQK